jgi:hypothetical protein
MTQDAAGRGAPDAAATPRGLLGTAQQWLLGALLLAALIVWVHNAVSPTCWGCWRSLR